MPSFYAENNDPRIDDGDTKVLQKVLGTLQTGVPVTGVTLNGNVSVGALSVDQTTPGTTNGVVVNSSALPSGAATQATLASILSAVPTGVATSANQVTANASLATIASSGATQATLASVLTKLADPASQTTLSALNAKVATETTLGAILAKLIAAPATESSLAALNAKVTAVNTGAVVVASGTVTANVQTVSLASSTAYEASRIVKASAGTLFSLSGYNSGPAQFLQVHNSASIPANGAAPAMLLAIPAQSTFAFEWDKGVVLSAGIVVSNSSTGATKTIGSADCYFTATYI